MVENGDGDSSVNMVNSASIQMLLKILGFITTKLNQQLGLIHLSCMGGSWEPVAPDIVKEATTQREKKSVAKQL